MDIDEEAGDILDIRSTVIDFDGGRVVLPYNLKLGNSCRRTWLCMYGKEQHRSL